MKDNAPARPQTRRMPPGALGADLHDTDEVIPHSAHLLVPTLHRNYAVRFHMFLIVATSVAIALLTTKGMLAAGVSSMAFRYVVALLLAYGTFFVGVWTWLHLSRYGRHLRAGWREQNYGEVGNAVDAVDIGMRMPLQGLGDPTAVNAAGGGGSFDGGGASASWDASESASSGLGESLGETFGDVAGAAAGSDEGGCALVIAGVLIALLLAVVFGAAAYVVYQAPFILAEVVFEVMLGSPLARGARSLHSANWVAALLRATWKPFAIVSAMAMLFAVFCHFALPQATSAGQVLKMLSN